MLRGEAPSELREPRTRLKQLDIQKLSLKADRHRPNRPFSELQMFDMDRRIVFGGEFLGSN